MDEAIVVPLKRFDHAKDRLRHDAGLDVDALAEDLARAVLASCPPRTVIVVSEDPEVSRFARSVGANVWSSSATNLNAAVQGAYEGLSNTYERLIIVHGDLRYPDGLGRFIPECDVTFYADHHGTGTNVLVIPTGLDFHFAYGVNSLPRHVLEAQRLELDFRVVTDSPWRFDVDEPSDLSDS